MPAVTKLEYQGTMPAISKKKSEKKSLTEQAYNLLRKEIVNCSLRPGLEFTEIDIAERLSMSKTPVREALMRLQFEGMVRAYPRRGYMIEPIKISDINEIFDLRQILEVSAAEFAVQRASDAEVAELEALSPLISDEAYIEDPGQTNELNNRFHEQLAAASGNGRLHRAVAQLLGELERFLFIEAQADVAYTEAPASHVDIVDALKARDVGRIRAAMADHIESTRNVLLTAVIDGSRRGVHWV